MVPFISSWKDVTIFRSLGDIQSCAVGWRGLSCWPSWRPWSGRWRRCRVAVSAPGTSPAAVSERSSCRLLISGIWSRTAPLDRCVQPALGVCSAPHGQRPSPQCSARRCHDSCYCHCGLLCSFRVWCWHLACPEELFPPPNTEVRFHEGGRGGHSSGQPWWPLGECRHCLELCRTLKSQWPCWARIQWAEHQVLSSRARGWCSPLQWQWQRSPSSIAAGSAPPVSPCCLLWSVMMSPVADFRGVILMVLGPNAFFMPSYMARMFPQSAESWMLRQRFSQ